MQGVEHFDSIFQKQNWNTELLEKKTQRQYAKTFSGDPHHFHVRSPTVIEIGIIILGENEELQISVTVNDVIDQAFRIDTDSRFVFCDASSINHHSHFLLMKTPRRLHHLPRASISDSGRRAPRRCPLPPFGDASRSWCNNSSF